MRLLDSNVSIPFDYKCPISQEIMENPVILCDGQSYERRSIAQWLDSHDTSPLTNATLDNKNMTPNHNLRKSIALFVEEANKRTSRKAEKNSILKVPKADEAQLSPQKKLLFQQELSYCDRQLAIRPNEPRLLNKKAVILRQLGCCNE